MRYVVPKKKKKKHADFLNFFLLKLLPPPRTAGHENDEIHLTIHTPYHIYIDNFYYYNNMLSYIHIYLADPERFFFFFFFCSII